MEGPVKGKQFKMNGHTLPGINQRSDDHPKNVAEQGLSGSSAFQKSSPAKDYKTGYYGEGKSSMAKQYGVTGAMRGTQSKSRLGGMRGMLGSSFLQTESEIETEVPRMESISADELKKLQKPAKGFKWVMLDGKPSQVNI